MECGEVSGQGAPGQAGTGERGYPVCRPGAECDAAGAVGTASSDHRPGVRGPGAWERVSGRTCGWCWSRVDRAGPAVRAAGSSGRDLYERINMVALEVRQGGFSTKEWFFEVIGILAARSLLRYCEKRTHLPAALWWRKSTPVFVVSAGADAAGCDSHDRA